jgi:serine/threonine-protein kinase HipA
MAPGSSLGGARPKANILDNDKSLWIAKFPSKTDTVNKQLGSFWPINWLSVPESTAPCRIEK